MSQSATLLELKDQALDYADMEGSRFPNQKRLTFCVNSGLSELHRLLVSTFEDYSREVHQLTLDGSQSDYTLPDNFYKVTKVWYLSGNRRYKIDRYELDEIDGYRTNPITAGTVEIWYASQFVKLRNDDDRVSISIPVGWEDYVAVNAAIRLLIKEESDPGMLIAERARLRDQIIADAEPRDAGGEKHMTDYYGRWNTALHAFRHDETYLRYRVMGQIINFVDFESLGV